MAVKKAEVDPILDASDVAPEGVNPPFEPLLVPLPVLEEPVGRAGGPVTRAEPLGWVGVPDEPPAALESSANPTEAGLARKTVYTFLRNVSPTIQDGVLGLVAAPCVTSKRPPMHSELRPLPI